MAAAPDRTIRRGAGKRSPGQLTHFRPGEPTCPSCGWVLGGDELQTATPIPCEQCGVEFIFHAFPAMIRERAAIRTGEKLSDTAEASCYYHVDKVAEVTCEECGRFICGLCDLELDGTHLCPACFQTGVTNKKIAKVENRRTLHDSVALSTAVLPMLTVYFTLLTAPIALFLSIRHWNTPGSILPRTKIRFIFAILISLAQLVVWGIVFVHLFNL